MDRTLGLKLHVTHFTWSFCADHGRRHGGRPAAAPAAALLKAASIEVSHAHAGHRPVTGLQRERHHEKIYSCNIRGVRSAWALFLRSHAGAKHAVQEEGGVGGKADWDEEVFPDEMHRAVK